MSFSSETATFKAFMGEKLANEEGDAIQVMIGQAISDHLVDAADDIVLKNFFGNVNGNLDESKTTAIIDNAASADPDMCEDATGTAIRPTDVRGFVRGIWDAGRQNEKMTEFLPKVINGLNLSSVSDTYKQGPVALR